MEPELPSDDFLLAVWVVVVVVDMSQFPEKCPESPMQAC